MINNLTYCLVKANDKHINQMKEPRLQKAFLTKEFFQ